MYNRLHHFDEGQSSDHRQSTSFFPQLGARQSLVPIPIAIQRVSTALTTASSFHTSHLSSFVRHVHATPDLVPIAWSGNETNNTKSDIPVSFLDPIQIGNMTNDKRTPIRTVYTGVHIYIVTIFSYVPAKSSSVSNSALCLSANGSSLYLFCIFLLL